jgi:glycosyltransferase involved in cell wall biosynthesis
MSRKTLGIVSSYNTQCGNASYTHVLKEEFCKHYDTDVIPINFKLLSNAHLKARPAIRQHIRELCETIERYDFINIQFESALFGYSQQNACQNVAPMIRAARNLCFTIHRLYNPSRQQPLWKVAIKNGLWTMKTLQEINQIRQFNASSALLHLINGRNKKGRPAVAIVHTRRERDLLKTYYDLDQAIDFPITFLNQQQIDHHILNRPSIRQQVCAKYELDPAMKYIGIFGFLSENKAHHVAVDTLRFLPENYKLLIFGSQHPLSIAEYDLSSMLKKPALFRINNNNYVATLIERVQTINAQSPHRIRFMGNLDDLAFIDALTAVDFVVLPYFETAQSGSGNASLAIEVGAKAILARNHAFLELSRYYPECYKFSDIGNAVELAQKIEFWTQDLSDNQKRCIAKYNIENNILIQKECFDNGLESAEKLKQRLLA